MSFQAIHEIVAANKKTELDARNAIIKRIETLSQEFDVAIDTARDNMRKGLDDLARVIFEKSSDLIGEEQGEDMKQAAE